MDFSIPDPLRETLKKVRKFLMDEVYPLEVDLLSRPFRELLPTLTAKRDRVREMGLFTPQVPKDHGGAGLKFMEHALLSEELGRTPLGHFVFNCQAPDAGNMEILHDFGSAEQKETWLKPLVAGKIRSCFSMTEPGYPGSNPVWMATTAVLDGDSYVINGRKWFTSSADGASFAIVMVVTDPAADPHARASQIIVPADTPGFKIIRNISVMGHSGEDWPSHSEIVYEDVRVPRKNLLGRPGRDSRSRRPASARDGFIIACAGWAFASVRSTCSANERPAVTSLRAINWEAGRQSRIGSRKVARRSMPRD